MTAITVIFFLGDILMTGRLIFVGVLAFYDRFRSHVFVRPNRLPLTVRRCGPHPRLQ